MLEKKDKPRPSVKELIDDPYVQVGRGRGVLGGQWLWLKRLRVQGIDKNSDSQQNPNKIDMG